MAMPGRPRPDCFDLVDDCGLQELGDQGLEALTTVDEAEAFDTVEMGTSGRPPFSLRPRDSHAGVIEMSLLIPMNVIFYLYLSTCWVANTLR
jgi:hypothetical protein